MRNPNMKAIHITKLVRMIFNAWFGYFEYVGYLPHGITLILLNYCFNLIGINFNWSTYREALSSEKSPSWNITNHFWHIRSVTAPSPHAAQIFFYVSVFTFLEIINIICRKCCFFSSLFNITMATQKFTNFDKSFYKCMLIWQLSHAI